MLNHSNKSVIPLTADDKFMIELLVDGELDEPSRRDLLVRLEEIEGGWRFCAITFLEAQCLSEAVSAGNRFAGIEIGSSRPPVAVKDKWNVSAGSGIKRSECVLGIDGSSALAVCPDQDQLTGSDAAAETKDNDPLIIPLRKGGYRNGKPRTSSGNGGGSWKGIFSAMAGGFLLALALTGVVALFVYESGPSGGTTVVNSPLTVKGDSVKQESNRDSKQMQMVTFKKKSDKKGVAVPCFEADDYDPKMLKELRAKTNNTQLEQWKKDGRKIDALYEEHMFPLDDGRVLIVPVDTYRSSNSPRYQ